jgi:hypothetical protein
MNLSFYDRILAFRQAQKVTVKRCTVEHGGGQAGSGKGEYRPGHPSRQHSLGDCLERQSA